MNVQKLVKRRHGKLALAAIVMSGLALLATAIPGFAARPTPEKIFALEIAPNNGSTDWANWATLTSGPVVSGAEDVVFTAKLYNRTPGNSNPSSFDVTVPSDFTLVSAAKGAGSNANAGYTISYPQANVVRVTGIESLKQDQFVSVAITVDVATTDSCSSVNSNNKWSAVMYAGNISSTTFRQLSEDPTSEPNATPAGVSHYLTTVIDPACGIRFGTQPQDASQGDVITGVDLDPEVASRVTVEIFNGSGVDESVDSGTVTLTVKSGPTTHVLAGNTASFSNGVATFTSLSVSDLDPDDPDKQAAGTYVLTAGYNAFSVDSSSFQIYDDLICPDLTIPDPEYSESNGASSIELQSTDSSCFGITVTDTTTAFGAKRQDTWSVTKSGTTLFQGYLTFTWDLSGTDPIEWTQVTWDGLTGYKDVVLCNFGVDYTDPTKYNQTATGLFPSGEEMCLAGQTLDMSTGVQTEVIAYDTDLGTRKVF